jgi:hypothetical protein
MPNIMIDVMIVRLILYFITGGLVIAPLLPGGFISGIFHQRRVAHDGPKFRKITLASR